MDQMVSEFRALRASVIKLWEAQLTKATKADVSDLTRFDESIDQAIAEGSVTTQRQSIIRAICSSRPKSRPAQSYRRYEDVGSAYFEYWKP